MTLHRFGLTTGLKRAREEDIKSAKSWMALHHGHGHGHVHDAHASDDESTVFSSSDGTTEDTDESDKKVSGKKLDVWNKQALDTYVQAKPGRCVVLLDGYAVDVTPYLGDHVCDLSSVSESESYFYFSSKPGGAMLLRDHSVRSPTGDEKEALPIRDASSAFHGGMNNHSRAARRRMRELRVARIKL